ncbi:MAG TPA: HU family DNA-binding protein [Candidatus Solibacter sp.]|nr:HU family DNA-binding protein [Candidatus Solibacter sp.]
MPPPGKIRCAASLTLACDLDKTSAHARHSVNKREIVGRIALDANLTRAQAARALEALLAGIQASLARGDRVTLSGFGSFGVAHRKARCIRNPRGGGQLMVQAKRVPRFAPAAELKTAVQERTEP